MLQSIFADGLSPSSFLLSTLAAVLLGLVIAALYTVKNHHTASFILTLALLPVIVQVVILMVNGNLGIGIAVAGAFSLVRFRSFPGSAVDICMIFLSMTVGLACGTGYVLIAAVLALLVSLLRLLLAQLGFGQPRAVHRTLHITIPESLDYSNVFDDLFAQFTTSCTLSQVKTTNLGSLFKLTYQITLKRPEMEKQLIDGLRCRNGNLEILCGHAETTEADYL